MSLDRVRYGRQARLPEIREAGQATLERSCVALQGAGDAREVEAAYLARAGVRVLDEPGASGSPSEAVCNDTLAALGVRDPAARDVASGALRALLAMRALLGIDPRPGG
jgi:molybdopterin/thiamine biosynthesis adenylyltransferase